MTETVRLSILRYSCCLETSEILLPKVFVRRCVFSLYTLLFVLESWWWETVCCLLFYGYKLYISVSDAH